MSIGKIIAFRHTKVKMEPDQNDTNQRGNKFGHRLERPQFSQAVALYIVLPFFGEEGDRMLEKRVAIVTGMADGIGRFIVERFLDGGIWVG